MHRRILQSGLGLSASSVFGILVTVSCVKEAPSGEKPKGPVVSGQKDDRKSDNSVSQSVVKDTKGGFLFQPGQDIVAVASPSLGAVEAPNLDLSAVELVGVSAGQGVPSFNITLSCKGDATREACTSFRGAPQPYTDMSVRLVFNSYGGKLNYSSASQIMQNAQPVVTSDVDPATQRLVLKNLPSNEGPLLLKRELLLVVSYALPKLPEAKSFRFFSIHVGKPGGESGSR